MMMMMMIVMIMTIIMTTNMMVMYCNNNFSFILPNNFAYVMGVKGKPDVIDIVERNRLQWYGHFKRMSEDRIAKLIMEWISRERRKEDVQGKRG